MSKKTIVTITPTYIERDSRTLKQAVSMARFGYRSILIEAGKSTLSNWPNSVELISLDSFNPDLVHRSDRKTPAVKPSRQPKAPSKYFLQRLLQRIWGLLTRFSNHIYRASRNRFYRYFVSWYQRKVIQSELAWFLRFLKTYYYTQFLPVWKALPPASLYYLHAHVQFPAVYLRAKLRGVPIIYDAHDYYAEMLHQPANLVWHKKAINWFYIFLEKRCMKCANEVITVSDGLATFLKEEFGRTAQVIRNCHDVKLDVQKRFNIREQLKLSAQDFLLISLGQAKSGQAVTEAIEALERLPSSVHLLFLGAGYDAVIDLKKHPAVAARVHIHPAVSPFEVVPLIREADASLIIYFSVGRNYVQSLPNKFFQAIGAELPLLYPALPEIKRLAERYQLGVEIDPQDPATISEGVMKLQKNPALISQLKQHLGLANDELSWEREEQLLRALIARQLREK